MKKMALGSLAVLGLATLLGAAHAGPAPVARGPIRVLIWDEQQPAQKQAYENFLGNAIADYLSKVQRNGRPEFIVRSVRLDDPQQGLASEALDQAEVLIWWGHQRHGEIKPETAKALVQRIKEGRLSLIALHSAHWSRPFIEAMNERTTQDALKSLTEAERQKVRITYIQPEMRLYRKDEPATPSWTKRVRDDGSVELEIRLPSCVFTSVKNDGSPSQLRTLLPRHPIARGVPETFSIPQTEIYGGPFFVPTPDAVIFEERWASGETFPAGCVWKVGRGQVFYFRPGHETYPIFKQEVPLRIVENAARWLGRNLRAQSR